MKTITIAGKKIELQPLKGSEKNGLWLELLANFEIRKFEFNDLIMLLFIPKVSANYTPLQLKKISKRLEGVSPHPVVFYYDHLLTYERDRLIAQGVYFVASQKYAFIPSLIINRTEGSQIPPETLYPSSQYILLYHLQEGSIEGRTLKELAGMVPYKYATIARAIQQLHHLNLIELVGEKEKKIAINLEIKELWEKAQPYLINPIKAILFSDMPLAEGKIGNISALSHYSMLAPEEVPTKVLPLELFAVLNQSSYPFISFEAMQRIEVWKYPPIGKSGIVDRLSLFLSLKEDKDPRVEKELEIMINEMPW